METILSLKNEALPCKKQNENELFKRARPRLSHWLAALVFVCISSLSFAQHTLINTRWTSVIGSVGQYDWSSTSLDPQQRLCTTGNKVVNGQGTNISTVRYDADGSIAWQADWNGATSGDDYGTSIIANATHVLVCGATFNVTNNDFDYVVLKYDINNGSLLWSYIYAGPAGGIDIPSDITMDGQGNIFVTGVRQGATTLADYCTLALNNSGTLLWSQFYDYANSYELAAKIVVNSSGDCIVTGGSGNSWVDGDFCSVRYSAAGVQLGVKRSGSLTTYFDQPLDMKKDASDNIYVVGRIGTTGNGEDMKLMKMDEELNIIWSVTKDGYGLNDLGQSIALDESGNIYVAGYFTNSNDYKEACLLKYDDGGALQWQRTMKSEYDGDALAWKLAYRNGKLYISGELKTDLGQDVLVAVYNTDGNLQWTKTFDGGIGADDSGKNAQVSSDNFIYVSGTVSLSEGTKYIHSRFETWENDRSIIYCDDKPCLVDDEVLVRFNPTDMILENTDNKKIVWGLVENFVHASALSEIQQETGIDLSKQKCFKVYPSMTSNDIESTGRLGGVVQLPPFYATLVVTLQSGSDEESVVQLLNGVPSHVVVATTNGMAELTAGANDTEYNSGQSSGLVGDSAIPDANINIEPAWDLETGSPAIVVGVYDTGINYAHTDISNGSLSTSSVVDGWDYVNNVDITTEPDPDNHGHGSAVAGIVGAWRNNSFGIAGIAGGNGSGGVTFHAMKIFDTNPNNCNTPAATMNTILQAMTEGTLGNGPINEPEDVQNHSWGGSHNALLREAFRLAYERQVVVCASSGNFGNSECNIVSYPSTYRDHSIMKIGANDATGARAEFSQCNWGLDFIAPGTNDLYIGMGDDGNNFSDYLTWSNNCSAATNGTSFAAPHAAGVAALMLSYAHNNSLPNSLSHEDCEELMQRFATDITAAPDTIGYDPQTGFGRLNAGVLFDSIQFPDFLIQHKIMDNTGSGFTLAGFHEKTCLEQTILGLPIGIIRVNRWKTIATQPHTIPSGYQLITGWARGSGSTTIGVTSANSAICESSLHSKYLPAEHDAYLDAYTAADATMSGYTYELLDSNLNHVGWWPFDTTTVVKMAYTLYLKNTTINVAENQTNLGFSVYPNPAMTSVQIQFGQGLNGKTEVGLYDVAGQLVKMIATGDNMPAGYKVNFSVEEFASGFYCIKVTNRKRQLSQKLLINH